MQSDIKKIEEMLEIKKIIAKMAFKHQDTVDLCTWGFLNKNKISAVQTILRGLCPERLDLPEFRIVG